MIVPKAFRYRLYPTAKQQQALAVRKAAYKETDKGITFHELRAKYPFLKKLPSLWTRSYFAATSGTVSTETT